MAAKFPHAIIHTGPHPPNPNTISTGTHIWIREILYVDDLALMTTCPRELQEMLHTCQQWSVQNRMQINTDKIKIISFFETPKTQHDRGGQHQPAPHMPPFHVYAPFPAVHPRSYLIQEVLQFEYLGLVLDPLETHHAPHCQCLYNMGHTRPIPYTGGFLLHQI